MYLVLEVHELGGRSTRTRGAKYIDPRGQHDRIAQAIKYLLGDTEKKEPSRDGRSSALALSLYR